MEGRHSVPLLELVDVFPNLLDVASHIVTRVHVGLRPFGHLPVFWITSGDGDLDEDFIIFRLRHGRFDDVDRNFTRGTAVDKSFFHGHGHLEVDLVGAKDMDRI